MGIVMMLLLYIDVMIYQLIAWIYNLVISASIMEILTQDEILDFTGRIYSLIGILVLFFVSYKIIRFIVNPDDAGAKGKGVGSIAIKIFVAILLTVLIPWGFEWGFKLQNAILSDDIIGRIVYKNNTTSTFSELGQEVRTGSSYEKVVNYNCDIAKIRLNACAVDIKNGAAQKFGTLISNVMSNVPGIGDSIAALLPGETMNDGQRFAKLVWSGFVIVRGKELDQTDVTNYIMDDRFHLTDMPFFIIQPGDIIDIVAIFKSFFGTIWYLPLIPTIAGGWCLFALGKLFFDIIMRLIKLTMLQLTAPFFTAAYVIDDSGKIFGGWLKRVGSLYIMIFVRIFVLQVAMYLIATISKNLMNPQKTIGDFLLFAKNTGGLEAAIGLIVVRMTLIFALLFFATKADKFFGELFPGMQNKDELNAKGAFDFMKKGIGTVVGLGAAVATAGAALPAVGAALGAGGTAGALGGLKAAAAGTNAVGAAFKSGKSAGGISGIYTGLKAGKESLEESAGRMPLSDLYEKSSKAYNPEEEKRKAAIKKTFEAEEKTRQAVFYDSKKEQGHAFAGMSSQQQASILSDAAIENKISKLKIEAVIRDRAIAAGANPNNSDELAAAMSRIVAQAGANPELQNSIQAAAAKISDSDTIKSSEFATAFATMVTERQQNLADARETIVTTNASINQYTSAKVEQELIVNNPASTPQQIAAANAAIATLSTEIANASAQLVDAENTKHQAETQLSNWGKPLSNQNQGEGSNPQE